MPITLNIDKEVCKPYLGINMRGCPLIFILFVINSTVPSNTCNKLCRPVLLSTCVQLRYLCDRKLCIHIHSEYTYVYNHTHSMLYIPSI